MWLLAATVFGGLAMLSGQGSGLTPGNTPGNQKPQASASAPASAPALSSVPAPASAPAPAPAPAAQTGTGAGGRLLAAAQRPIEDDGNGGGDACSVYNEQRDYLPLHRWTSFELFVVDNARIFKTQRFVSMIASLMFMAGGLCWRIIGSLMGFGYTFDMICQPDAAKAINSVFRTFSLYAAWFLIPSWLFVLAAVVKRWTSGARKGPASGMRLIAVFLAANGVIFFMGDQADQHQDNPTAPYTAPWAATTVQGWFGTAADSLNSLQQLGRFNDGTDTNPVFYDNHSEAGAGPVTCAKLDKTLYEQYSNENAGTTIGDDGKTAMAQVSKMWEISLVRSWQAAQFGEGTKKFPSPAHASCRFLEAKSDVGNDKKLIAYDLSTGNEPGTTQPSMARGYYIDPGADEQMIFIAWGACKGPDGGRYGDDGDDDGGHTILQWDAATKIADKSKACKKLFSDISYEDDKSGTQFSVAGIDVLCFMCDNGTMGPFYFNGDDELKDKLGDCYSTKPECRADWNFASAWLGKNQAQRLTQGLMAMIVAFVFLFVMGPMAIGMTVSSVGLAGLVMILPITLLLIGAGLPQGMRLLKLTGAAAAGDFLFTLGLTFMVMLTDTTYQAVEATTNDGTPNFFQQVAQGAAPLVALFLFRKISRILSLGDISSTTGATGFASAIILKSSGDRRMARNPGQQVGQRLGRLGVGRARLAALDEKSLQRRLVNNRATRAVAGVAKRGAQRATRPITDWARDRYDGTRARLQRGVNNLQRKAASGSPAQRAAAYAGLTAGLAGLTMVAPPAVLATLPLMAFTGSAAALRGGQAAGGLIAGARNGGPNGDGSGTPISAAGMPTAASARTGLRQADDWHRNIIRVSDPEEQRRLEREHTEDGLNMHRARLWGAGMHGGLNPEFTGFVNDEEKMRALADAANAMGLNPSQLQVSNQGLIAPDVEFVGGRPQGLTAEQFGQLGAFLMLPPRDRRPQMTADGVLETKDQQIARMTAQVRERGYMTDDGEIVNILEANGLDTRIPEVRVRVERWLDGGKDEEISRIVVAPRRGETAAVEMARNWAADVDMPTPDVRNLRDLGAVSGVMQAAQSELDFNNIRIDLPDGTATSAGNIQRQIEREVQSMLMNATETKNLHDARVVLAPEFFNAEEIRLTAEYQDSAQRVDRLSAMFRDAVDASRTARGVCDLRVQMADPSTMIDTDELARLADQIGRQNQQAQQEWHEELDRLIGAISQTPQNANGAGAIIEDLDRLRQSLEGHARMERADNDVVLNRLEDLQQSLQASRRMTQVDPRLAANANTPVDIRRVLRDMYQDEMSRT
ncbi:hypothetical protein ACQPZP_09295 [Spirillospora sp. CA-142024]|uniref:hypothetical protein n=1 Tax=Spirillospora sp. CA-142024 TaxID=3240036 RepID=UPI003D9355BB